MSNTLNECSNEGTRKYQKYVTNIDKYSIPIITACIMGMQSSSKHIPMNESQSIGRLTHGFSVSRGFC